jgi:hypothetical protein
VVGSWVLGSWRMGLRVGYGEASSLGVISPPTKKALKWRGQTPTLRPRGVAAWTRKNIPRVRAFWSVPGGRRPAELAAWGGLCSSPGCSPADFALQCPPRASGDQNTWKERHVIRKTRRGELAHWTREVERSLTLPYAPREPGWCSLGGDLGNSGK